MRVRRQDRKARAGCHGVGKAVWWKARFQSRRKCAFSRCQDVTSPFPLERFKCRCQLVFAGRSLKRWTGRTCSVRFRKVFKH